MSDQKSLLAPEEEEKVLSTLKSRFMKNLQRHQGVDWDSVAQRLQNHREKLWTLVQMEITGGEPDVVGAPNSAGEICFIDCSLESPAGRRSLCYDEEARNARKENKPQNSALGMARALGIDLLDEEGYKSLQSLGPVDRKTSSWIKTPPQQRSLGGALFGDWRYDRVFIYHNGADSYYAARGFRGLVWI